MKNHVRIPHASEVFCERAEVFRYRYRSNHIHVSKGVNALIKSAGIDILLNEIILHQNCRKLLAEDFQIWSFDIRGSSCYYHVKDLQGNFLLNDFTTAGDCKFIKLSLYVVDGVVMLAQEY